MNDAEFHELMSHLPIVGRMVGLGKLALEDQEPKELADVVTCSTAEEHAFVDGSCRYAAPISRERTESTVNVHSIGIVLSAHHVMLAYAKPGDGPGNIYTISVADIKEYNRKEGTG